MTKFVLDAAAVLPEDGAAACYKEQTNGGCFLDALELLTKGA